ncbi:NADH dehydrogenase [ubiquinone] 1 alpha subcomplex subunit 10, mitochondrial [Ischnura elegans]|uniref:NADH dehydrogenase [ubiquinone] 1 alpha subcomplex subunit 10, mitochondrial n=1 Tax=Ischnura elegans TaxID=197161 RepID=UPI001ED89BE6|nr:NADH dehydrogenase [ubiquinone] 1 alpha subcomplex subunit 10, mitochondrial [Ischnura elegans]
MALVIVRSSSARFLNFPSVTCVSKSASRISQKNLFFKQCAFISGKALRDQDLKIPAPYPYKEKRYLVFNAIFDRTTRRLNENSKIISVEGPIAAGKTDFAKKLAEDLDFYHIPEATLDDLYITPYNFDLRTLDPQLPEGVRTYDEKNFCLEPSNRKAASFQIQKYQLRYFRYVDALAHVLNTGQGVVIERSPYSDYVFAEAMFSSGFISARARRAYYEVKQNTIQELMKPHLVIYLDVPVNAVKENIKKRNHSHEVQSKALSDEYLRKMESVYKTNFLKEISEHAELLVYDWSRGGDVEVVVEDIERIDFERFDKYDKKMKDWRIVKEWDWADRRALYTNNKSFLMTYFNVPVFDVPELLVEAEDLKALEDLKNKTPGLKYRPGYNADAGDKVLFKTHMDYRNVYF